MKHTRAYIICATPRSGTTLLCDLLTDTKVAGEPDSFFRLPALRWWARELSISAENWQTEHAFDREFLTATLQRGAGNTQVFGMRLMWCDFGNFAQRLSDFYPNLSSDHARIHAAFRSTCFIHLSRKDKIAQAISLIKAKQSGLWHVNADGTERERAKDGQSPVYDMRLLAEQVAEYEKHDAAWVNWFTQQNIEPLRITYEALANDPQAVLSTVLAALNLDPEIAKTINPRTMKLADSKTQKWKLDFELSKPK